VPRRGLNAAAVVEAAAAFVDAEGLEGLTLARLAERLGVSTPALYKHVDGLDALKRALALLGLAEMSRRLGRAAAGKAGAEAIEAIAHAYRDFARAHPGVQAATRRAPARGDDEWSRASQELLEIILAVLTGFGLEGDDALHAIRGFRSLVDGFTSLEAGGGFGLALDPDESFRRLVRVYTDGLSRLARDQVGRAVDERPS
jgi:AcrR family transcriptional regulator